jgi:post-segregation antitoxin (ccd killing protein)
MEKLKSRAKSILGISINPYLYKKLKAECDGKNVSAFVEKAIAKELEQKEKERKEFRKKLIKSYQAVAKSQKRQAEDEV